MEFAINSIYPEKECGPSCAAEGGGPYQPVYRFRKVAYKLQDFLQMCEYHQTSPDSQFTQRRLITQLVPEGRITLTDQKFTVSPDKEAFSRDITSPREFEEKLLMKHFSMDWQELKDEG